MKYLPVIALAIAFGAGPASGQASPRVDYTLHVDSADLPAVSVEMHIRGVPASFQIAMATHPEYDDQYWRYLTDLSGVSNRGSVAITREDSAVWRVRAPAGDVTLHYRVHYPAAVPGQQAAWKAHLTQTGGLVGGPHSFLYVVGGEAAPVRATIALPRGWMIATGLTPGATAGGFSAPSAEALIDSPIMVGHFRSWQFMIDGVPHGIAYLGRSGGVSFDSTLFVANVERIARATAGMFGWMPYRRFQFLFEDGASGGLEHLNSISIGVQSTNVARDPNSPLPQIAHEFFHVWNEVHLRPASWIGIRHVAPAPTGELWWAEGVTLYYADLLMRRAGLHTDDSTRLAHLEHLITTYNANPSHGMVSLEHTSRQFNLPIGGNGDYTPSMYTQGEVVGSMLDLMIRGGSNSAHTLDDVMRKLTRQFTPARGFTDTDVERAVADACACDARSFFDRYVRAVGAVDFNRGLAVLGLRAVVTWEAARGADGALLPDTRLLGYLPTGEHQPRLLVWFPSTEWGRAGLHTGDRLVSWNGAAMNDAQQLRTAIMQLHIADTARVSVMRDSGEFAATVVVSGYDRPVVRIEEIPGATATQRAERARWMAGQ
jgi:predicted metalloprotease with PDZ domain